MRQTRRLGLYAFIFGVSALALIAGVADLLIAVRDGEPLAAARAPAPSQVGRAIPTSFGVISVDQFVKLREQESQAAVRARFAGTAIQIAVTLTNLKDLRLPVSARQFAVRVDATGGRIAPAISSLPVGGVTRQSARKALFRFVVPNEGSPLMLVYRDPRRRSPLLIGLGRVDTAGEIPLNLDVHVKHGSDH